VLQILLPGLFLRVYICAAWARGSEPPPPSRAEPDRPGSLTNDHENKALFEVQVGAGRWRSRGFDRPSRYFGVGLRVIVCKNGGLKPENLSRETSDRPENLTGGRKWGLFLKSKSGQYAAKTGISKFCSQAYFCGFMCSLGQRVGTPITQPRGARSAWIIGQ
jgi:hypothetical protein